MTDDRPSEDNTKHRPTSLRCQTKMTKTIILLCVSVVPCCLAGVAGCGSQSDGEHVAVSDSKVIVQSPPLAVSADQSAETPSVAELPPQRSQGTKAKPDNPRIGKFAELDKDQNGQLTLAEFSGSRKDKEAKKWFERRDVDRDGYLNLAEFVPTSAPREDNMHRATEVISGQRSPAVQTPSQSLEGN